MEGETQLQGLSQPGWKCNAGWCVAWVVWWTERIMQGWMGQQGELLWEFFKPLGKTFLPSRKVLFWILCQFLACVHSYPLNDVITSGVGMTSSRGQVPTMVCSYSSSDYSMHTSCWHLFQLLSFGLICLHFLVLCMAEWILKASLNVS